MARPCRGHQVAQEVKGFGSLQVWAKWIGSHCCDESAGLSPQHQASLSPRARQWGWASLEPCFQQNQELTQPLNHNGGPECGPHHARTRHSDALRGRALVVSGE